MIEKSMRTFDRSAWSSQHGFMARHGLMLPSGNY